MKFETKTVWIHSLKYQLGCKVKGIRRFEFVASFLFSLYILMAGAGYGGKGRSKNSALLVFMSYHVMSGQLNFYHVMSGRLNFYHVMSGRLNFYHVMLGRLNFYHVMSVD